MLTPCDKYFLSAGRRRKKLQDFFINLLQFLGLCYNTEPFADLTPPCMGGWKEGRTKSSLIFAIFQSSNLPVEADGKPRRFILIKVIGENGNCREELYRGRDSGTTERS